MSQIRIGDGTGKGFLAKVDEDNRLATYGAAEHQIKTATKRGDGYGWGMSDIAVPGGNVPIVVTYMRFDDPDRNFFLDAVLAAWNGGSTTYNKPLSMQMMAGAQPPTANYSPLVLGQANLSLTKVALATGYLWNGVGSGMTMVFAGVAMNRMFFAQGTTRAEYNGGVVYPKGMSLAVQLSSPEAGIASVYLGGWFES